MHPEKRSRHLLVPLVTLILIAAGIDLLVSFAPEGAAEIVWFVRANLYWIIPVVAIGLFWGLAGRFARRDAAALVAFSLLLLWVPTYHAEAAGRQDVTFAPPVPGISQGDGFVADYDHSQYQGLSVYVHGDQDYPFITLIRGRERQGLLDGYGGYVAVIMQNHPQPQLGLTRSCRFSDRAQATLDGTDSNSLARKVNALRPLVMIDEEAVRWDCSFIDSAEVGRPQIIMPLKKQRGFLFVTEVEDGVATYDGITGTVTISDYSPAMSTRISSRVDSIVTKGGRPVTAG